MATPTPRNAPSTETERRGRRNKQPGDPDDFDSDFPEDLGANSDTETADDGFQPDDDSDLGLEDDDGEDVGLDTATGPDDISDDEELDGSGEGVSWTADSDAAEDLQDTDADSSTAESEEYGWLGEDDSAASDDDDFGTELDEDVPDSPDDGGAEGLDDDTDLDEYDLSNLPALENDSEDGEAGQGVEGLDELGGDMLGDEPMLELSDGARYKALPVRAIKLTQLALPNGMTAPSGIAVLNELVLIGSAEQLCVSQDGGVTFKAVAHANAGAGVAVTRGDAGTSFWARDAQGRLIVSRHAAGPYARAGLEEAPSWISGDQERASILIGADSEHGARLLQSNERGKRFVASPLPEHGDLTPSMLGTCRTGLLFANEQLVLCALRGEPLSVLLEGARTPAFLLDEDDEVFGYACVFAEGRTLLVRVPLRAPTGSPREPLALALLELATHGRPLALCASQSEGLITLHVATDRALLRIEASLDGEALA